MAIIFRCDRCRGEWANTVAISLFYFTKHSLNESLGRLLTGGYRGGYEAGTVKEAAHLCNRCAEIVESKIREELNQPIQEGE